MGPQASSGAPTAPRVHFADGPRPDASHTFREQMVSSECRHRREDVRANGAQALSHLPSSPAYSLAGRKPRAKRVRKLLDDAPAAVRIRFEA